MQQVLLDVAADHTYVHMCCAPYQPSPCQESLKLITHLGIPSSDISNHGRSLFVCQEFKRLCYAIHSGSLAQAGSICVHLTAPPVKKVHTAQ